MPSSAMRWSMLMARPKHRRARESTLAVDDEAREALAHGHQFDRVDVEMRSESGDPPDRLGNVLRSHRVHSGIELVGSLLVAAGANDREFRLGHPRFDRRDPDSGAVKVGAEVERE